MGIAVAGRDQRWNVSWSGPTSSPFVPAFVISPIPGSWQPNTPAYMWIGASASGTLPQGTSSGASIYSYTFTTLFDDPGSVAVSFRCAKDNTFISYSVNGVATTTADACGPVTDGRASRERRGRSRGGFDGAGRHRPGGNRRRRSAATAASNELTTAAFSRERRTAGPVDRSSVQRPGSRAGALMLRGNRPS